MSKTNHSFSIFLNFSATPRVTTTLIPLHVCPTEYCQTVKQTSRPVINIIENVQEQNKFENKSKGIITTHLIGDWIIRESSEPFQRKGKERSTPIEQVVQEEKKVIANESITPCQSSASNINQWTVSNCFIRLFINLVTKSRLVDVQYINCFILL
jgi:hypothetical protein